MRDRTSWPSNIFMQKHLVGSLHGSVFQSSLSWLGLKSILEEAGYQNLTSIFTKTMYVFMGDTPAVGVNETLIEFFDVLLTRLILLRLLRE